MKPQLAATALIFLTATAHAEVVNETVWCDYMRKADQITLAANRKPELNEGGGADWSDRRREWTDAQYVKLRKKMKWSFDEYINNSVAHINTKCPRKN